MNSIIALMAGLQISMRFSDVGAKSLRLRDFHTLVALVMFWAADFRLIPKAFLSGNQEQELAFIWGDHRPMPPVLLWF